MGRWLLPQVEGLPPGPRGAHACVSLGDSRVLVFGGADRAPVTFNDLWILETADGKYGWTRVTPIIEPGCQVVPRSGATLTLLEGKVFLFGGTEPVSGLCLNDLKVLDPETWTWSNVEAQGTLPPARHSHCAGCLADTCMVIYGGAGYQGPMQDIWIYNSLQNSWSQVMVSGPQPAAREMHSGCMVDDHTLLVYGGRGAEFKVLCDVATFDARQSKWVQIEPTPFSRCAHSSVLLPPPPHTQPQQQQASNGDGCADPVPHPDQDPAHANGNGCTAASSKEQGGSVIVYGGFSGEAVEGDVLRIDSKTLEIELLRRGPREADKAGTVPSARFAHSAAVVRAAAPPPPAAAAPGGSEAAAAGTAAAETALMVVYGGVNPKEDLSDVAVWVPS